MHETTLSPEFRAALRQRRGGSGQLFETLEPQSTALLVIDMQNVFVDPDSPLAVPVAQSIVSNINRLAQAMRSAGSRILWVRSTFTAQGRSSWPLYFEHFAPLSSRAKLRKLFADGSPAHAFWPGLQRHADDALVDKDRFSAFSPQASALEERLAENGIENLVITGTLTNVCCESTMRDAMMRDYRCVLIDDATAAASEREHLAALENAARYFGDVTSSTELLSRLTWSAT